MGRLSIYLCYPQTSAVTDVLSLSFFMNTSGVHAILINGIGI